MKPASRVPIALHWPVIESGAAPGPHVRISVTDTGTGMSDETLSHLFEPFFTTKAPGEGTGLGLATVYGIVRNWSGGLRVESEIGHGSTFEVYLPVAAGSQEPARGEEDRTVERGAGSGKRVLVVEDEKKTASFIRKALQAEGKKFEYKVYDNAPGGHYFNRVDTKLARESRAEIWRFLARYLTPANPVK